MNENARQEYVVRLRSKRVQREFDALRGAEYERVIAKLKLLAVDPRPRGCEKIYDAIYRVRIGNIRIIYLIQEAKKHVEVGAVRRRSEKTYKDIDTLF